MRFNPQFDRMILSSRVALIAGFGGLLVIVTLVGLDTLRVLRQIRTNDDEIRQEFLFRDHLLNSIRSDLYVSGTYVRDYLLDPEPGRAQSYLATLQHVRSDMDSALESYGNKLSVEESGDFDELKSDLARYWQILDPVLQLNDRDRHSKGYAFLRDEVFPRRMAMLDVANRIAEINEQQLKAGNERGAALLESFQNRVALTLLVALILGLGMAVFSTQKILRLESHAQSQYQEVAEARRQLENLSARLVQAQETERRSLARELHDEVGQSLSAVLVELRNLSIRLAGKPESHLGNHVETIKGLVENTVRTVRNMSLLLRPSMLDDLGLIPALQWQAREVSRQTNIDISVETDLTSDDLPDDYKTCIYRVVQEALHNCASHSHASAVRIRVSEESGHLVLLIGDNGTGFDVKHSKGLGMLGMEERVTHLGGRFHISSEPGSGTTLSIDLPYSGDQRTETRERHSYPAG